MTWEVDPVHSDITFRARHMMVAQMKGTFGEWSADFDVDPDNYENSSATVRIKSASLDTRWGDRDGHLKSADFFDVEQYPEIVFKTTKITRTGDALEVTGDLTIKDVTKPVTFEGEAAGPVADPWGGQRLGLSAEASIDRKDWGLVWNVPLEAGGVLVGDRVTLSIDLELVGK